MLLKLAESGGWRQLDPEGESWSLRSAPDSTGSDHRGAAEAVVRHQRRTCSLVCWTGQEWRTQACPTNAASAFRMLSAEPLGANVVVTWECVAGVSYIVERSTDPTAGPSFTPLATIIPGQTGTTVYTNTNAAQLAPVFYRIAVP